MTLIIIIAIVALLLALLEIFVIPGFGLAGIGSIVCAVTDVVLVYNAYGLWPAVGAIAVALAVLGLLLWWVARSKAVDRMALHATISSTNATEAQLSVHVGDEGTAITRLALVGNARFGERVVEVKSAGAFIDPATPIRVVSVSEALITVEPC